MTIFKFRKIWFVTLFCKEAEPKPTGPCRGFRSATVPYYGTDQTTQSYLDPIRVRIWNPWAWGPFSAPPYKNISLCPVLQDLHKVRGQIKMQLSVFVFSTRISNPDFSEFKAMYLTLCQFSSLRASTTDLLALHGPSQSSLHIPKLRSPRKWLPPPLCAPQVSAPPRSAPPESAPPVSPGTSYLLWFCVIFHMSLALYFI